MPLSSETILQLEEDLCSELLSIAYSNPPVYCIYNPIQYAKFTHKLYLDKCFAPESTTQVLFLGMNPGPYGMGQTGVPFGDVTMVRDYLGIEGPVSKPEPEHPNKRIEGFNLLRKEVSGTRFWGLMEQLTQKCASKFYETSYVHNYCPLAFLTTSGKNVTPPSMPKKLAIQLESFCDRSLQQLIGLLQPSKIIGIGKYAFDRAQKVLGKTGIHTEIELHLLLHPSPINPTTNKPPGWTHIATQMMQQSGVSGILNK